ncbi:hypothetical protein HPC49_11220 [Pyxidicoccus fallax]|uniref:Lipoprotein n=1 Tax=Pyxidicoccus fallax TaxID=394095 RepID=A0A848LKL4_9BACT|nr:hypothetical protein [Pyxidicoccus fallax]NMO18194.1 hypothetical protein [Pyxidicoccus fallax]NPC78809.1 hypothetical protein [Pyxidicoccus fallax]
MSRRMSLLLLCAVAVWAGCGSPVEPEETLESAEQGLACAESQLIGSTKLVDTKCSGPWEYALKCYPNVPSKACDLSHYGTSACCRRSEHGIEIKPDGTPNRISRSFSTTVECLAKRRWAYHPDLGYYYETYYDCGQGCSLTAQATVNTIPAEYRQDPAYPVTYTYSISNVTGDETGGTGTCSYTIRNWPVYIRRINEACTTSDVEYGECTDTTKPEYKSCRAPSSTLANDCGGPARYYTATGKTRAEADAEAQAFYNPLQVNVATQDQLSSKPEHYSVVPTCLTAEPLPMGTESETDAKFDRLRRSFTGLGSLPSGAAPTGVDRVALEEQLVKRMKMLYEVRGHLLSDYGGQYAAALYGSKPQYLPPCGTTWVPPATTAACTSTSSLPSINGTFTLCSRMLEPGISARAAANAAIQCASVASTIKNLSLTDCAGTVYRDEYHRLNLATQVKGMSLPLSPPVNEYIRVWELSQRLHRIQQWYENARTHLYPAGTKPDPKLLAGTSEVLKAFWNTVYLKSMSQTPVTTDAQAEALRLKMLHDGLAADLDVLNALSGGGGMHGMDPAMWSAPALYVLSDALRGLEERLEEVSRLHDMGCRFKTCQSTATQTSQLWKVLGNLDRPAELASIAYDPMVRADWRNALGAIADYYWFIESAVNDAAGTPVPLATLPEYLSETPVDSLSDPLKGFASLLKEAKARTASYSADGLFFPTTRRTLSIGFDEAKLGEILGLLNTTITQTDTEIAAYRSSRLTLVQGLLGQLQNQSSQANITSRLELLAAHVGDLSKDLNGLRISHAVDEATYGDFMENFEALVPAIEQAGQDLQKSAEGMDINARDHTRHTSPGSQDLSTMWVLKGSDPLSVVAAAGDSVNVQVSGRWAPQCALSRVTLPDSKTPVLSGSSGPILTGPEGYAFTVQNSEYVAESVQTVTTEGKYSNWSWGAKLCAGLGLEVPVVKEVLKFTASLTGCVNYDGGRTWSQNRSESDSEGNETRSSFTMAQGVRSELTPFPNQPVGALLLVQMPPDVDDVAYTNKSLAHAVQVVQAPYTSVFVDRPSKLYLVVNDIKGSSSDPASPCNPVNVSDSRLSVRMVHMVSKSEASKEMARAMLVAQAEFQTLANTYVAQGRLLPSQSAHLGNTAYQKLYLECSRRVVGPCVDNVSYYPQALLKLFDTWVTKEIVDIEREVELVNIERQIRSVMLEVKHLEADYLNAQAQARLLALAPAWALRNLDGNMLRVRLETMRKIMGEWLAPAIDVKYPEIRTPGHNVAFTPAELTLLNGLTTIDPLDADIELLLTKAEEAAKAVENRLRMARTELAATTVRDVFVSIPRHDKVVSTRWSRVDTDTARAVWEDILADRNPEIVLSPAFLYKSGQQYLECNHTTPVINTIGLYVAFTPSRTYTPYTTGLSFRPATEFQTASGLHEYDFVNDTYLGPSTSALVGVSASAASALDVLFDDQAATTPKSLAGTGLSPFTRFTLDLTAFRNSHPSTTPGALSPTNPLYLAEELIVGLRLEARQQGPLTKLPNVTACQ